jgi:hypothetical protein
MGTQDSGRAGDCFAAWTRQWSLSRLTLLSLLSLPFSLLYLGCVFDSSGLKPPGSSDGAVTPDGGWGDAATGPDAAHPGDARVDAGVGPDAAPDVYVPPCTDDTFECLGDGSARICRDGAWVGLGPCPLGCDAGSQACRVPSNVDAVLADDGDGSVTFGAADSPVHIDTDTGRIYTPGGPDHRPAGPGLDPGSGIFYGQQTQGAHPGIGVLVLGDLIVQTGVEVVVEGSHALAVIASGNVSIDGALYLNSVDQSPGPGGFSGGAPSAPGGGACGGQVGGGSNTDHGCSSGGGGGGHGGVGGDGGDATCDGHVGGAGGGAGCGTAALVPLVGGHGGAGAVPYQAVPPAAPGAGGGGGGAIQISVGGTLSIGAAGRIHAGGGPGGGSSVAGGAGGGAGGAILLEGPVVSVAVGGLLAANGGGGGGGDCT